MTSGISETYTVSDNNGDKNVTVKTKGDNFDHYFDVETANNNKTITIIAKARTPLAKEYSVVISESGFNDGSIILKSYNPKIDISNDGKIQDIKTILNDNDVFRDNEGEMDYIYLSNCFYLYLKSMLTDPEDIKNLYNQEGTDFFIKAFLDKECSQEVDMSLGNSNENRITHFSDLGVKMVTISGINEKYPYLNSVYITGIGKYSINY